MKHAVQLDPFPYPFRHLHQGEIKNRSQPTILALIQEYAKRRFATSNAVKVWLAKKKRKRKKKKKKKGKTAEEKERRLSTKEVHLATDKGGLPCRNYAPLFQCTPPLSSHSKEPFNEGNLYRVSFDVPSTVAFFSYVVPLFSIAQT